MSRGPNLGPTPFGTLVGKLYSALAQLGEVSVLANAARRLRRASEEK